MLEKNDYTISHSNVKKLLIFSQSSRGRLMMIAEKMPAGTTYQISVRVRARICSRSQPESRLASFGEDYAPFTAIA